ncbi:MAG: hypothetical protein ACOYL6_03050 [Bacteriovoracaceae bacterium]
MKIYNLIFLLFFLLSCQAEKSGPSKGDLFFEALYNRLIATTEISYLNRGLVNSDEEIKSPSNAWQTLFNFKTLKPGSWSEENYCLYYKIPYGEHVKEIRRIQNIKKITIETQNLGVMKLVALPQGKDCAELYYHTSLLEMDNILSLKSYFKLGREMTLQLQYIDMENMRLKTTTWTFPFFNLMPGKIVGEENYLNESYTQNQEGESSQTILKLNGLRIQGIMKGNRKSDDKNIMMGNLADGYQDKTLIKCHELSENCEVLQHFRCNQCRFGWFEVAGGKCPGIKDKFCGQLACGRKGEPACPRGQNYNQFDFHLNCANDSATGFCQRGLKTICDNNVLICI